MSHDQVAYYCTCQVHRSVREDTKTKFCKKELSVTNKHPEEVVVRILAWWLVQGLLTAINYCNYLTSTAIAIHDFVCVPGQPGTLYYLAWY